MPFVVARTNVELSEEQTLKLKEGMGRAIALIPGKSESALLLAIEGGAGLYLAGDGSEPVAYIDASVYANEDHAGCADFAAATCALMRDIAGVSPARTYVKFTDIDAWSVAGSLYESPAHGIFGR